jgi:hypothetical protein
VRATEYRARPEYWSVTVSVGQKLFVTEDFKLLFKTIKVDGLNVFYREVGQESAPKLVLLHGFPAASHQYRNLIPAG